MVKASSQKLAQRVRVHANARLAQIPIKQNEFVIAFTRPTRESSGFGALLLGLLPPGTPRGMAARSGQGSTKTVTRLGENSHAGYGLFLPLAEDGCRDALHWVKPKLIAHSIHGGTAERQLRHPSYSLRAGYKRP